MFDVDFFIETHEIKRRIVNNDVTPDEVEKEFLRRINPKPHVFNIETTNACNMTCVMCPRTSLMKRPITLMEREIFESVLDQVEAQDEERLKRLWAFVKDIYGITFEEHNENSFYFHIVAKHLTLHGYGEPMVDRNIVRRVQSCTERGIPTYFSCVPANMTLGKAEELMKAGLGVLKFSIDSLEDEGIKKIRGKHANFQKAFQTILDIIEMKAEKGHNTILAPTMIELSGDDDARGMQGEFLKLWKGKDVFAYIKSQDNRWFFEEDPSIENRSHYAQQYCEFPWTSMTVMAAGEVVPCTQDYDAELSFGNIKEKSLREIWNGEEYTRFREMHITGKFPPGHKCAERCDQRKLHSYFHA